MINSEKLMDKESRKKYGAVLGLALMADWFFALMFCHSLKFWLYEYFGYAIVTASFIGIFLYTNTLEDELRKTEKLYGINDMSEGAD